MTEQELLAEVAKLRDEQTQVLKDASDQWKKVRGPYAPFKRHGDYIVIAKSQAYLDAKPSQQEKMKGDANHFFVSFFPTLGHAKVASDKLQAMNRYASVVHSEKEFSGNELGVPRWAMLQKIRGAALEDYETMGLEDGEKNELQKARKAVYKAVSDLYLSMVSENSARQSMRPLKKVAGFDEDMLRSFATHGAATAHYVAALEKSSEMQEAIITMRDEARKGGVDRAGRMRVFNELLKRYAAGIEFFPMDWQNKALQFNSTWMLLTSPAYYVQNSLQPFMMTLPLLDGDFGAAKSWRYLLDGYGDIKRLMDKSRGSMLLNIDAHANEQERSMLRRLKEDNVLDIGIERELGEADFGQSGVGRAWQWANQKLASAVRGVEVVNRVSSALAAYRMATEKYLAEGATPEGAHAHAVNYARGILRQTHGDYSDFNAPRIMRQGAIKGLPIRLIMQFRKYQVIQLSLTARILGNVIKDGTPEEKAVARAQLRWLLAHHTVVAGALGSPIIATLAQIMGMLFGDDGEDEEAMLRRVIGNKELSDLLLRGAPAWAGVNLSQRLGMGQMTSLLPYTDVKLEKGKQGYFETIGAALGPFLGGLLPRFADGVAAIGRGDIYKGTEMMLPSGLMNAMRSYRELTQGVTTRAGDTVLPAEDISMLDAAFRVVGFPTSKVTDRNRIYGAVQRIEQHYEQEAAKIRLQYAKDKNLAAASRAWMELQAERAEAGLRRQPLSNLIKAGRAQDKREQKVYGGVEYTKTNEALVRRLANQ